MQKLDRIKCEGCGILLHPSTTVELCPECANSVWVVMNIYENGSEELSAIYRTAEDAKTYVKTLRHLTDKLLDLGQKPAPGNDCMCLEQFKG